jgi:hypothetical protein
MMGNKKAAVRGPDWSRCEGVSPWPSLSMKGCEMHTGLAQCISVCRRSKMVAMGMRSPRRGSRLCRRWVLKWREDGQLLGQCLRATKCAKLSDWACSSPGSGAGGGVCWGGRGRRGGVHRPLECPIRFGKVQWVGTDTRIGVRFQYEWHDDAGPWYRSDGKAMWELNERGVMRHREASIHDVSRAASERKCCWPAPGPRLADPLGIPDIESPGLLIRFTRPLRGNHP